MGVAPIDDWSEEELQKKIAALQKDDRPAKPPATPHLNLEKCMSDYERKEQALAQALRKLAKE